MNKTSLKCLILMLVLLFFGEVALARTVYVDDIRGNDRSRGTREKPFRTIDKAAAFINRMNKEETTTLKIAPGIYTLRNEITFSGPRNHKRGTRLRIEASILPGDAGWEPKLMPVIMSAYAPKKTNGVTETYGFKIDRSNVTIRGLKFMGNPTVGNWHCCISRTREGLEDLVVMQCMFVGGKDSLSIYCGVLATGNKFVVDHCVFSGCYAAVVFWDGTKSIGGKGCAIRNCIIEGSHIAGVWTCKTDEDLEFRNNVVSGGEYFWMRKEGDKMKYLLEDCMVAGNKYYSGYGVASGAKGQTGSEVSFIENGVVKTGNVVLKKNKLSDRYLHVPTGSAGSELSAGLFFTPKKDMPEQKDLTPQKKEAE